MIPKPIYRGRGELRHMVAVPVDGRVRPSVRYSAVADIDRAGFHSFSIHFPSDSKTRSRSRLFAVAGSKTHNHRDRPRHGSRGSPWRHTVEGADAIRRRLISAIAPGASLNVLEVTTHVSLSSPYSSGVGRVYGGSCRAFCEFARPSGSLHEMMSGTKALASRQKSGTQLLDATN